MGGISLRASWVQEQRKKHGFDLLVDGGNTFFRPGTVNPGSKLLSKAQRLFNYYKKMRYDSCLVSMSDLVAGGIDFFLKLSRQNPILFSLNIEKEGRPVFIPYKITEIKGIKVAYFGITGKSPVEPKSKNFTVVPKKQALKRYWPKIKAEADIIICLSDLSRAALSELLLSFPEIDVVISSGIMMPTYVPIKIGKTLVISSHEKGKSVGIVQLSIDKNKNIKKVKNYLYMLQASEMDNYNF